MLKTIIVLSSLGILASQASAISKNIAETKKFYIDQEAGTATVYGKDKSTRTTFGKIGFEESVKYLMINMGSDILFGDFSNYTIFDDHFIPDEQKITPNPTGKAWWSYEKRSDHFKKVSNLQRTCLETVVDSNQAFNVSTPFDRLCDSKMENDGKRAILRGYTCYVELDYRRTFSISHRIRKECTDKNFLAENNILAQETTGGISYSISDNDSGSSNYKILGRTKVQMTMKPQPEVPVYDDFQVATPNWPSQVKVDQNFAGISLRKRGSRVTISPKILADNQCGDFRSESTICDYIQPMGFEFKLYKVAANGTKTLVSFWYDGGILPAQWRGIVPLKGYPAYIEKGNRYELTADARYPAMYYRLAKEKYAQFLIPPINSDVLNNPDLDVFPSLEGLKWDPKLGKYPQLPDFEVTKDALKGEVSTFDAAIKELENLIQGSGSWPPYLSKICSTKDDCYKQKNAEYTLKATFAVGEAEQGSSRRRRGRSTLAPVDLKMTKKTNIEARKTETISSEIKFERKAIRRTAE